MGWLFQLIINDNTQDRFGYDYLTNCRAKKRQRAKLKRINARRNKRIKRAINNAIKKDILILHAAGLNQDCISVVLKQAYEYYNGPKTLVWWAQMDRYGLEREFIDKKYNQCEVKELAWYVITSQDLQLQNRVEEYLGPINELI